MKREIGIRGWRSIFDTPLLESDENEVSALKKGLYGYFISHIGNG